MAATSQVNKATIAIEDRRFWQHGALDYQGILRAAIRDAVNGGSSLQGASTLTMQLVDNVYLPQRLRAQHNLKYKIIQAKLAEQLEGMHSKHWILNSYLNDVPYGTVGGQTAYGVQAAARMFFDKPVWKLTLAQAALLAGLPQAPSQYNPFIDKAAARQRRAEVLQAMVQADNITQAQAAPKIDALAAATRNMAGCGKADEVGKALGADVVANDSVKVRDLPPALQDMVLKLSIGQATPPFGSSSEGVRVLVLCGRDDPVEATKPSFDQIYTQLNQERINRRAMRYLRDLRRDAVVDYR